MALNRRQMTFGGKLRKFDLGCDIDKEEIFTYPYLIDDDTVTYIKKHGRIMFIIRGPNSTLKATLSEMIKERYPTAKLCCADHYFKETFSGVKRTRETLKLSHDYCEKKVQSACLKSESPIIVQNTHIRKSEFQKYLDMASQYNYTVIMAITLYKFKVSAEDLGKINPDGLHASYFQTRLRQWEDIAPEFTGWFLSPGDAAFILKVLHETLPTLLSDEKFCRVFNFLDNDAIWNFFDARKVLYCIAGYAYNRYLMKKYYLSDMVQECYGQSYPITIQGFLVTLSGILAITHVSEEMSQLIYEDKADETLSSLLSSLDVCSDEHKATIPFSEVQSDSEKTAKLEDWLAEEFMDLKKCRLIHLAQRRFEPFGVREVEKKFFKTIRLLTSDIQYSELDDGVLVYRLQADEWLVRLPQKIKVETIFTGLYV